MYGNDSSSFPIKLQLLDLDENLIPYDRKLKIGGYLYEVASG